MVEIVNHQSLSFNILIFKACKSWLAWAHIHTRATELCVQSQVWVWIINMLIHRRNTNVNCSALLMNLSNAKLFSTWWWRMRTKPSASLFVDLVLFQLTWLSKVQLVKHKMLKMVCSCVLPILSSEQKTCHHLDIPMRQSAPCISTRCRPPRSAPVSQLPSAW